MPRSLGQTGAVPCRFSLASAALRRRLLITSPPPTSSTLTLVTARISLAPLPVARFPGPRVDSLRVAPRDAVPPRTTAELTTGVQPSHPPLRSPAASRQPAHPQFH
ncbi:hypothetical protein PSPO01_13685 [Paraphaeosphaeria sporulosa]